MKKLFQQAVKFGLVGFICFFIDYFIGIILFNITKGISGIETASMIGSACGFTISVIFNYTLSFKFVFERKENMDRKAEFVIFIILSIIGLGLNQLIVWVCMGPIYGNIEWINKLLNDSIAYTGAKVVATAIVMVYNFISRKIFLEKKD